MVQMEAAAAAAAALLVLLPASERVCVCCRGGGDGGGGGGGGGQMKGRSRAVGCSALAPRDRSVSAGFESRCSGHRI
jgi:hypothetical protein